MSLFTGYEFGAEGLCSADLQHGSTGDHADDLRAAYAAAGFDVFAADTAAPAENGNGYPATAAGLYFEELSDRLAEQGVVFPGGALAVRHS